MRKFTLAILVALLIFSGVALARQSGEEKSGSSMPGMMQQMMGGEKAGGGMGGMQGMMGMMNMMGQMTKMMDQCTAMMSSGKPETQKAQ
ncbi:MAG: hypothetical protein HYY45_08360 [Deltaproteobacteria bacterium]|nr:hypothetical protein [Deltaproteobacteria bacterium]MBI3060677.1 hypothetical protein [Deltaproteobacteria bacterium]